MRTRIRTTQAFVVAATLGLAACNRSPEPLADPLTDNMVVKVPIDDIAPVNSADVPIVDNAMMNAGNIVAPPEFSDSEQMRDDADATGLTARLPTEEAPGQPVNETQPAQ